MFTFSFFVRLFFSGLLGAWGLSYIVDLFELGDTLIEKISYWISYILFFIAMGCIVIGVFGVIWTF